MSESEGSIWVRKLGWQCPASTFREEELLCIVCWSSEYEFTSQQSIERFVLLVQGRPCSAIDRGSIQIATSRRGCLFIEVPMSHFVWARGPPLQSNAAQVTTNIMLTTTQPLVQGPSITFLVT